jgi:hypothetical protein
MSYRQEDFEDEFYKLFKTVRSARIELPGFDSKAVIHTGLQPGERGPRMIKKPFSTVSGLAVGVTSSSSTVQAGGEEYETVKTVSWIYPRWSPG